MEALIDLLLDWVAQNTPYETAAMPHPAVVERSPELLTREFYSGIASLMPEDGIDERLDALFAVTDGAHGTIYILDADTIDGASHYDDARENPVWREILLHELVHHAEARSGAVSGWECRRHGEMEAYSLGGRSLDEARIEDPMPNRMFWAHAYSRC
ncbi:MAG: hypothetical protein GYB50_03590 [Rhodobacteraceae bacterium]|nr:hypothetical protein [Paracoccaceae bacterium]